jgi:hypothetical protein
MDYIKGFRRFYIVVRTTKYGVSTFPIWARTLSQALKAASKYGVVIGEQA